MAKTKILICGATGFVGRNIAEYYAANPNYEVFGTFFTRKPFDNANIQWYNVDLTNDAMVDSVVNGMDIVIQAAAITSGCRDTFERPWLHVTDNAVLNAYIFRAAFKYKVKNVVFFSCSTMYGGGHCNEETPINPNPAYFGMVNTKLYNEKMCEFYANLGDTKFTVIRGSNFYGPYDKYDLDRAHVFGATVTKVMNATDTVNVWGDGSEARDICYISDLVNFVDLALSHQEEKIGIYNCGYGECFTIKEIVENIIEASEKPLTITFEPVNPSIRVSTSLDCRKAGVAIGWVPLISLKEGIAKTLSWFKAQ